MEAAPPLAPPLGRCAQSGPVALGGAGALRRPGRAQTGSIALSRGGRRNVRAPP